MKQNNVNNTPAIKYIDGQPFVRVIDLGHMWNTNSSNILAIGKPHHVPEEQLRRIDGRVWCSFQGLRYRMVATKHGSSIAGHIREFLNAQAEKPTEPKPETQATDLGTAALIADARRTASQALKEAHSNTKLIFEHTERLYKLEDTANKQKPCRDHVARHQSASATVVNEKNEARVQKLEKQMDAVKLVVKSAANIAEEASEAVDRIGSSVEQQQQQAADLGKENADIIRGEIERLTKLSEHVDHVEKDASAHRCDALERVRQAERNQRDNTARISTLEEHARAVDWTLAAVAVLGVVGRVVRLLHRR